MNCNYATKTQKDDPCQKGLAFYMGAFNHFLELKQADVCKQAKWPMLNESAMFFIVSRVC